MPGASISSTGIRDLSMRGSQKRAGRTASAPASSFYEQAQRELEGVQGLYQPGGAYDQAFNAAKARAAAGAQASLVSMGMGNVYNPQASGAAFEAENRGQWELNRTQGLASAMTASANLLAGRGSELYGGALSRELTGMQIGGQLAATGMRTGTQRTLAREANETALQLAQMKQNAASRGSLPSSPFQSARSMWG